MSRVIKFRDKDQFTGALDMRGVELYENDKVLVWRTDELGAIWGDPMECTIIFHDGGGGMWSAGWVFDRHDGKYEAFCINGLNYVWYAELLRL